jgi:hypothetical protein
MTSPSTGTATGGPMNAARASRCSRPSSRCRCRSNASVTCTWPCRTKTTGTAPTSWCAPPSSRRGRGPRCCATHPRSVAPAATTTGPSCCRTSTGTGS